jgi:hypothetical protein
LISNKFQNGGERPEQGGSVPLCTCSPTPHSMGSETSLVGSCRKTTYAPMIYTAEFFGPQMALPYRLDAISQ